MPSSAYQFVAIIMFGLLSMAISSGGCLAAEDADPAQSPVQAIVLTGRTMGTTYRIKYWGDGGSSPEVIQQAVTALLEAIDRQMSTYRDDSELSRFNAAGADQWFPVSPATAYVVGKAIEFHQLTGGASDVTVGPVVRLWRPQRVPGDRGKDAKVKNAQPPSDAAIAAALQLVGADRLQMRTDPPALRKDAAAMSVDLSSIAPGYAVDLIIELLASRGFPHAVVEIGGEVRAAGERPDGQPWKIGVESPILEKPALARALALRDTALTTSGDYRNVRVLAGQSYSHLIDPRTGRALPSRGTSTTVVAETCLAADAMGTALAVMGPEAARQWCVEHQVAAMFQQRGPKPGEVLVQTTPRFDELFSPSAAPPTVEKRGE